MQLTRRQREVLEMLTTEEYAGDLVQEGREVWIGDQPTNWKILKFLLWNVLVSEEPFGGTLRRYRINEWGRRALTDPDFDPWAELAKSHADSKAMT